MTASKAARKSSHTRAAKAQSGSDTDAIAQLTEDHARVKKLFKQYDKLAKGEADASERQELAAKICAELTAHTTAEEEIFYPAARDALGENADLIDEAMVEHASAKDLIRQIQNGTPDDDEQYDAKVKVLGEYVTHHVEEEEGQIFPKVRRHIDGEALGEQISACKSQVLESEGAETPH